VPVRGDGKGDNVLAHAAALARGFNAHIEITHCRAKPENLLPFGVPIPAALRAQLVESTSQVFDIEEAGLRGEVLALSKILNIRMSKKADGKSVTANFVEEAGRQIDVIGHHGRLADIIAVAKPDIDRNLGANTLKAALFNTGRPVLMCPEPIGTIPDILGSQCYHRMGWITRSIARRHYLLANTYRGKNSDNPDRQVKRGQCKASRAAGISVRAWHFVWHL
jgi:hypothetical protein